MCVWGFGCCGPPPWATIKAYDNTTPWALDWYHLKDVDLNRESAVDYWPSATPPSAVMAIGGGTGSTLEGAILVRDTSDGSLHEESTSTPLTAVTPPASRVTLITDNSTTAWWTQREMTIQGGQSFDNGELTALAFDSSLVQQCLIETAAAAYTSAGRNGTDLILGHGGGLTGTVAERYDTTGTLTASFSSTSLSVTGGRTLANAKGFAQRSGTSMIIAGSERSGSSFWRRYWRLGITGPPTPSFTLAAGVTGAAATFSGPVHQCDVGGGCRCTSTHLFYRWVSNEWVCVSLASLAELWTATLTAGTDVFLAIDASNVYTVNISTKVLSARAVATGTVAWTLDLTGSSVPSSASWGKILSGGFLAVMTPLSTVAIVNVSTGALVTAIDVGAYDVVERDSRYIVVGPVRTTSS